jgi:hypothetical protein
MCVAQLLLSRASRKCIYLAPLWLACLFSFCSVRLKTSFGRLAPTLLQGNILTLIVLVEAGCCRVAPGFQLHKFVWLFVWELHRTTLVQYLRSRPWTIPSGTVCRLTRESPRGAPAHGDSNWKVWLLLACYLLFFERVSPMRASACTVWSCMWTTLSQMVIRERSWSFDPLIKAPIYSLLSQRRI